MIKLIAAVYMCELRFTSFESGFSAYWMLHSPTTPRWRTVLMATDRSMLYSRKFKAIVLIQAMEYLKHTFVGKSLL